MTELMIHPVLCTTQAGYVAQMELMIHPVLCSIQAGYVAQVELMIDPVLCTTQALGQVLLYLWFVHTKVWVTVFQVVSTRLIGLESEINISVIYILKTYSYKENTLIL